VLGGKKASVYGKKGRAFPEGTYKERKTGGKGRKDSGEAGKRDGLFCEKRDIFRGTSEKRASLDLPDVWKPVGKKSPIDS